MLLKNTGNVLPLQAPKTMAVVGSGARPAILVPNEYAFMLLNGYQLFQCLATRCSDRSCNDGVLAVGWGSG